MKQLCACNCGKFTTWKYSYIKGHKKALQQILTDCACGCGSKLSKVNKYGHERKYINHHFDQKLFKTKEEMLANLRKRKKELKESFNLNYDFPKEILKICKECNIYSPHRWNSTFNLGSKTPQYKSRCNNCMKAYCKIYRKNNTKKKTAQAKLRRNKLKDKYIEYLGGKCKMCSYVGPRRSMTFHHRNKNTKTYEMAKILDWSWEKVKPELDKCDLLCFRCHMEIEDKE